MNYGLLQWGKIMPWIAHKSYLINDSSIFSKITKSMKNILFIAITICFTSCYAPKWANNNNINTKSTAPANIQAIFQNYPNGVMSLEASSPGYEYDYDIGEKDVTYGKSKGGMAFEKVEIRLQESMPIGSILTDVSFIDQYGNVALVENLDLMRLIPRYETEGDMLYSEILLEEFDRFGVVFRKEHEEFNLTINSSKESLHRAAERTTRMNITNNCLEPTKWEMSLTSENYTDFGDRVDGYYNINQNKILAHSWFFLDKNLYDALLVYKNPSVDPSYYLSYDSLNDLAQESVIDFENLRYPLNMQLETKTLEIGHQSNRKVEPVDVEEYYKRQFGLFLNRKADQTYANILEEPVQIARFTEAGFYNPETPNTYDYGFLKYTDQVTISNINSPESDCYVELKLTGDYAPYEVVIGNIDLAYLQEQKVTGLLFGYNTYPKSRRYNPKQTTLFYDADNYPEKLKPYLVLVDKSTGKWVNNQKKGVEKIYLSYETSERKVLQIYLLSYERVTPVWMARVKLPNDVREAVRVRKSLYAY